MGRSIRRTRRTAPANINDDSIRDVIANALIIGICEAAGRAWLRSGRNKECGARHYIGAPRIASPVTPPLAERCLPHMVAAFLLDSGGEKEKPRLGERGFLSVAFGTWLLDPAARGVGG
jgi:hypothetical protein